MHENSRPERSSLMHQLSIFIDGALIPQVTGGRWKYFPTRYIDQTAAVLLSITPLLLAWHTLRGSPSNLRQYLLRPLPPGPPLHSCERMSRSTWCIRTNRRTLCSMERIQALQQRPMMELLLAKSLVLWTESSTLLLQQRLETISMRYSSMWCNGYRRGGSGRTSRIC